MASGDFTIKPLVLDEYKINYHYITDQYIDVERQKIGMHQPGIEPGAPAWQAEILPLNHWYSYDYF